MLGATVVVACGTSNPKPGPVEAASVSGDAVGDDVSEADSSAATPDAGAPTGGADVIDVQVSGEPGAYSFSVTLRSPDTGCSAYADWWEVVDQSGALRYRRILGHSHVDEQPFTRSGGPVDVGAADNVLVRAHFNPGGYGGAVMVGSAAGGFSEEAAGVTSVPDAVETEAPLPTDCAF